MVGAVGITLGVAGVGADVQALKKINRIKAKNDFFIIIVISQPSLLNRGLKLRERSHPGDAVDEFCQ